MTEVDKEKTDLYSDKGFVDEGAKKNFFKTMEEIEIIAKELSSEGKLWHFHMLTPDCSFNESGKQAFVLEDVSGGNIYVTHSEERYMDSGKRLVELLHNMKVPDKEKESEKINNDSVQTILDKAQELNNKGIAWHHHMLFPDCVFNKYNGKWNIIFEDKESGEVLEALYDNEPTEDLREVEKFFYAQKE